jgi:hypothetical protein
MKLDKLKDKIESKFRRGFASRQEGFYRPDEYSPEQLGWDAAEAVEKLRKDFLNKALNDFQLSHYTGQNCAQQGKQTRV